MSSGLKPRDDTELAEAIAWAAADGKLLEIVGSGSKREVGRPTQADFTLDLSALSGITLYEPEELVLSAGAATGIADIRKALTAGNQEMAFEPPDLSKLMGSKSAGTIGGVLSANLSGPRRMKAGAARDHFLGVTAVSGRGDLFKSGGRVVKNVTGYDMCKGLAGAWGTLAAMAHVTIKVLPRAETAQTVALFGLDAGAAVRAMTLAMQTAGEVSGAAHIPKELVRNSSARDISGLRRSVTGLRLEGIKPSVAYRAGLLQKALKEFGSAEILTGRTSEMLWRDIRNVDLLADKTDRAVWRVSVPPASGGEAVSAITANVDARLFLDWAGGLIWLDVPADAHAHERAVRGAISPLGGHATLIRARSGVRAGVEVFQPLDAVNDMLSRRLKKGFDPSGILNHGRMYAGI